MTLDATSRESNVWDSIRKFFVDNLVRGGPNIPIGFDIGLASPKIAGNEVVEKWVNIESGTMYSDTVSEYSFNVICCTRKDNAGFKLTQLRDTLMGYLKPSDGQGIIPLYQSRQGGEWGASIAGMLIYVGQESERLTASNEIKFKVVPITLKWGAKT